MKHYIQKPSLLLITSSLLSGAVLVVVFLAQMGWRPISNCQNPLSTAATEGCVTMEYGYPKRFLSPSVNVGEQNVVFGTINVNYQNLVLNWLILSGASFVAFYILTFEAVWPSELKAKKSSRKSRGK